MRYSCFGYSLLGLLVLLAGRAAGQGPAAHRPGGTMGIGPGITPAPAARPATTVPLSKGVGVAGPVPAGTGLRASYYAGPPRGPAACQRVEPTVSVTWRGGPPAPGVPGRGFSVRWTGYVRAPETGLYVLHTEWDDATDISFAGANVLSMEKYEPEYFGPNVRVVPVDVVQHFVAGQFYRIDLAYKDVQGVSRAVLAWARPSELGSPSQLEQAFAAAKGRRLAIIPQQFLYPELPRPQPVPAAVAARPVARQPSPLRPVARARPRPTRPLVAAAPAPLTPAPLLPSLASLPRGTALTLPHLYFTQSTADLLPASRPVLNALAQELRQRPALRVLIAGHTDNVGDAGLNLRLSQQRARVVRRYLVQQGIDSLRLTAQGYGGARPVADNRDPQQRPRNRRVEVVVQ